MKRVIIIFICILSLSSCVRKADIPLKTASSIENVSPIVFLGEIPYSRAKELQPGEYIECNVRNTDIYITKFESGYMISWYHGGTIFINNEDF